MKGMRFYEEFTNKRKGISAGNAVGVFYVNGLFRSAAGYMWSGAGALFDRPNSPVATSGISPEYLAEKCKRVSERRARAIHPELFKYLDE